MPNVMTLEITLLLLKIKQEKTKPIVFLSITETANVDNTPLVNPDAFKYLEHPPTAYIPNQNLDEAEKLIPPHVIIPLQDTQIKEGEPVILVAKIDGYPKPKVIIPFYA